MVVSSTWASMPNFMSLLNPSWAVGGVVLNGGPHLLIRANLYMIWSFYSVAFFIVAKFLGSPSIGNYLLEMIFTGGVLMDDIEEALPHAQKAIRKLTEDNHIATATRQQDKKLIVFYRPKGFFNLIIAIHHCVTRFYYYQIIIDHHHTIFPVPDSPKGTGTAGLYFAMVKYWITSPFGHRCVSSGHFGTI